MRISCPTAGTLFPPVRVQDSQPRSASRSRPDPVLTLRPGAEFPRLSFEFLSQFVESRSSAWLLLPANPHQGVNTRGAVFWSLHAKAPLHSLLHLLQRLQEQEQRESKEARSDHDNLKQKILGPYLYCMGEMKHLCRCLSYYIQYVQSTNGLSVRSLPTDNKLPGAKFN